jgi:hypothetical protein
LIAEPFRPAARRQATSKPRGVSIATGMGSSELSPWRASNSSKALKLALSSLILSLASWVPS